MQETNDKDNVSIMDSGLNLETKNENENKKLKKVNNNNLGIIVGSLIIASAILLSSYTSNTSNSQFVDPDSLFKGREIRKEELFSGTPNSKVILLEYSDLECQFCKKFHNETMVKIRETYKDKVAIGYRHFPLAFHKRAPKEAEAALCVRDELGQIGYFKYMSKIFEITKSNDGLDPSLLPTLATEVGIKDLSKWETCLSSNKYTAYVQADLQDGLDVGVEGTPNTFVLIKNGNSYNILTLINGARDLKYVQSVLDQALKISK